MVLCMQEKTESPYHLIPLKIFSALVFTSAENLFFSFCPPLVRNISSTLRGSQTAALHRLAEIESRIRSHKQTGQGTRPAENLKSNLGMSVPSALQSLEASVQLSAQSSSDHSLGGKRFLKKNKSANVINSNTADARSPDVGFRPKSRAADRPVPVPSVGLGTKSVRVISGVSLESDEEDMRRLLGDSPDSMENSFSIPERPSSIRPTNKVTLIFQPLCA